MTMAHAEPGWRLEPVAWGDLAGFPDDDHDEAFRVFRAFCAGSAHGRMPLRPGVAATAGFAAVRDRALTEPRHAAGSARRFFEAHFRPWRIVPGEGSGFLTGYYEPEADGSLEASGSFAAPILARPDDLVSFPPAERPLGPLVEAARRGPHGGLEPYPDRAAIEAGAIAAQALPLVWLRDHVEVFLIQVQGSARVRLADGRALRLVYDGRNGRPYTSIGRLLVEAGHIPLAEMSLARLKAWLREASERGRDIMRRNGSYIFFRAEPDADAALGPTGGAGTALTPLRSIAVDRTLWPYGTPFWLDAKLPWRSPESERFAQLMIAEDTGSAIVGPARADIFFGSGDAAGTRAGGIRHAADFTVLLPADDVPAARPGCAR